MGTLAALVPTHSLKRRQKQLNRAIAAKSAKPLQIYHFLSVFVLESAIARSAIAAVRKRREWS